MWANWQDCKLIRCISKIETLILRDPITVGLRSGLQFSSHVRLCWQLKSNFGLRGQAILISVGTNPEVRCEWRHWKFVAAQGKEVRGCQINSMRSPYEQQLPHFGCMDDFMFQISWVLRFQIGMTLRFEPLTFIKQYGELIYNLKQFSSYSHTEQSSTCAWLFNLFCIKGA